MRTAASITTSTSRVRRGGRAGSLLLLALLSASLPVLAEPGREDRQPQQQQRQEPKREQPRQEAPRQEPRPQQAQPAQPDPFRRDGRLTPDERGDLRRQIKEAGKELYPAQPQKR